MGAAPQPLTQLPIAQRRDPNLEHQIPTRQLRQYARLIGRVPALTKQIQEAFHDLSPLIALISDATTGKDIAMVPMISHLRRGIRIVEFADLGVSDNNAPILALDAALDAAAADAIGKALIDALRATMSSLNADVRTNHEVRA